MSIKLEWEVDADESPERILHDPGHDPRLRRQRRRKQWGIGVAVAVVIAAILGAHFRLRAVDMRREELLDATIQAELLALRIGDYSGFMRTQSRDEPWREHQRETFTALQALGTRVTFEEEIVSVERDKSEAEIVVEARVDGELEQMIWLYTYTQDGWRHIASPPEPWAQQEQQVGDVVFRYHAIDQPVVDELTPLLEAWQETVKMAGRVRRLEPLEIRLESDLTAVKLEGESPTVIGVPVAGPGETTNLVTLQVSLGNWLAELWAEELLGDSLRPSDQWVREETEAYLRWVFHRRTNLSPLLTALEDGYGLSQVMRAFIPEVRGGLSGEEALRVAVAQNSPGSAESIPFHEFLTAYLRAETIMAQQLTMDRAAITFMEHGAWNRSPSPLIQFNRYVLEVADPDSYAVVGTYASEDVLWAELEYRGPWQQTSEVTPLSLPVPFRFADGYWQHTAFITDADWGAARSSRSGNVQIFYQAADTPFVDGLAGYMDDIYARLAADLEITVPAGPISVRIEPSIADTGDESPTEEIAPRLTSPLGVCCVQIAEGQAYLRQQAIANLMAEIVSYRTQKPIGTVTPIMLGIAQWQAVRIDPQNWELYPLPESQSLIATPSEVWTDPSSSPYERLAYSHALLNAVESVYGHETALILIDNFDQSEDLDAWLATAEIAYAEIESPWRYFIAALETQIRINALYDTP